MSTQLPDMGFLRLNQIIGDKKSGITPIIPITKSAWWNGIASGRFPKPVKLGPRLNVWRVEDIRSLIDEIVQSSGEDAEIIERDERGRIINKKRHQASLP